jgi:predicted transcriptional regulator of viral defense system
VKTRRDRPHARSYIDGLAAAGRYHFTSSEARTALGVSPAAARLALNRLARKDLIASPARGFYVIVPPEYRSLRCLPAEQFVPALLERLKRPYYAGLLTAAQYHGAAHQRPQAFQVFVAVNRRPIHCGAVRVDFLARKGLKRVPVEDINTPRGTLRVSSPEATALDLVGYAGRAGGLNQVATVLAELGGRLDAKKLAAAARTAPVSWAQRLGYLLDDLGFAEKSPVLKAYVARHAKQATALLPRASRTRARRNKAWKLDVNATVDLEL